jgi:hypothetical protein
VQPAVRRVLTEVAAVWLLPLLRLGKFRLEDVYAWPNFWVGSDERYRCVRREIGPCRNDVPCCKEVTFLLPPVCD